MGNVTCATASFATRIAKKGVNTYMKMLNFSTEELILQNIRQPEKSPVPEHYTKTQYQILCKLIRRKRITKKFFSFLLAELYNEKDWHRLSYEQMYEFIHILTYYDYKE